MKTYTMALLAGVAIGAIALQGLHAQGAKLKAYAISEAEILILHSKPHTSLPPGR